MNSEVNWGPWDPRWLNKDAEYDNKLWEYAMVPSRSVGIASLEWAPAWFDCKWVSEPYGCTSVSPNDRIFRRPKQTANPPIPVSIRILEQAAQIQRDRSATYDQGGTMEGERSMGRTVQAFNTITGRNLSESEGWLLLQILKDVRDRSNGPHEDSLVDCTSYSSLKAEARLREAKNA